MALEKQETKDPRARRDIPTGRGVPPVTAEDASPVRRVRSAAPPLTP